jgi:hypothetical protein
MRKLEQGGSAIRSGVAAFFGALVLLAGAAPAHAGPSLRLAEYESRAGEVMHFSISDIDEDETYVLEIGDRRVADGSGTEAEEISGQFTMPDLGGGERKVTVEAEIGDEDDSTTVKRKLRYLGGPAPAPAIAGPPAPPPPAPAPASLTPAPRAPDPIPALTVPAAPASPSSGDTTRSKRATRRARKGRTTEQRPSPPRRVESRRHDSASKLAKRKRAKAKRDRPRTAPLFDGVPESSSGGAAAPARPAGSLGLNAVAPPTAALTRAAADTGAQAGPALAVLVPALLGLAALALGCTAVLRGRRRAR